MKEQPENYNLFGDLALTNMGLGDKLAAFSFIEKATVVVPLEKDALNGPVPIEILARVSAQMGEPDRALAAHHQRHRVDRRVVLLRVAG